MYAVQRPAHKPRPRLLVLLAGAFIWTSADGNRQCAEPPPAPRPIVRAAEPTRHEAPAIEFYYPAEPEQPAPPAPLLHSK